MRSALVLLLAAVLVRAADVPMTLVSEDEAEPIHSAIVRKEAWTLDPVKRIRADADRHMREGPWTVTSDRPRNIELDPHEYYSEGSFWWPDPEHPGGPYIRKEGQANPDRFVANRTALNSMCDAVLSLGTAAYFLDDGRYAQRAARIINTWFINPKTRMNPDLQYSQVIPGVPQGRGSNINDGRAFIRAIQGMEFLIQTGTWDEKESAAVRKWFEEYLRWLTSSKGASGEKHNPGSRASWWTAQVAAVSTFVGSRKDQQMAFNYYRDRLFPRQARADLTAAREEGRPRPVSYLVFNLEAFASICRIAQVQGVDLWSAHAKNGATLATEIDFLEPYLSDPKKWAKEQAGEFPTDQVYFLAFAGMGLRRPEYVALFHKLEHPEGAWASLIDLVVGRWEAAAHQTRH